MTDETKAKFAAFKSKLKKHAPEIISVTLGIAGAIGWGIVIRQHKELVICQTISPDAWPVIEVHPETMKELHEGATLKYREAKYGDRKYLAQSTTLDDFSDDENRMYETFKKTGETHPHSN